MKQKIVPHIWFNHQAIEAAKWYTSIFNNSKIENIYTIEDTPSGKVDTVEFSIMGYQCMAINAGPLHAINPSISLMINFDPSQDSNARQTIDQVWQALSEGGNVLMPLDTYPFSERYGWVQDKYGLTWQLIYTNPEGDERPLVLPALLFVEEHYGKAEEASDFYLSLFNNSQRGAISRYPAGAEPNKEGTVMFTDFKLAGDWFAAMDGGGRHAFGFNEMVSFVIQCDTQKEIDYFWDKLSSVPESEQCGWVKDKYGISWQILPSNMQELLLRNPAKTTPAMLKMKKIIIDQLVNAGTEK